MTPSLKRGAFILWLLLIAAFTVLYALHLRADFPNHSPWTSDWAKYTDEGWYGNAAIRAHLFGHWYVPGDFNPAVAVPVLPALEWILFSFSGVTIQAARALVVCFFVLDLALAWLLLRANRSPSSPRSLWMALLALTLAVTSPFLYSFSRLAILEPLLIAFLLIALNLAVRLGRARRPVLTAAAIGLVFTLMLLTKTTAVFLLPAVAWAIAATLWPHRRQALRCLAAAAGACAVSFACWLALVVHAGLWNDFTYFFFINRYVRPNTIYWPLISLWWALHGVMWADRVLMPLAGAVVLALVLARRQLWASSLVRDPVFVSSVLAAAGYLLFMTEQYHPQPRYYTVVALFSFLPLALAAEALLRSQPDSNTAAPRANWPRLAGVALIAACAVTSAVNGIHTLRYAAHPEYTWVTAAADLTRYIDDHPNGNRILVSISGDDISLMSHIPTLCDDFGTIELAAKLQRYQPGWWAGWNDIDPGTLEDLHRHYSLEQVASFPALDDPDRNLLVLFKLHPLPHDREPGPQLQQPLPGDKIDIDVQ